MRTRPATFDKVEDSIRPRIDCRKLRQLATMDMIRLQAAAEDMLFPSEAQLRDVMASEERLRRRSGGLLALELRPQHSIPMAPISRDIDRVRDLVTHRNRERELDILHRERIRLPSRAQLLDQAQVLRRDGDLGIVASEAVAAYVGALAAQQGVRRRVGGLLLEAPAVAVGELFLDAAHARRGDEFRVDECELGVALPAEFEV